MADDRASATELLDATRQLAVLTRLGYPLADGLKQMAMDGNRWLGRVSNEVAAGDTLTQVVERHPRVFSPFYRGMVVAAEGSDNPSAILTRLGQWLERLDTVEQEARTVLYYPLLLLNAAILQIGLVAFFIGPIVLGPLARMAGLGPSPGLIAALQSPLSLAAFLTVLALVNIVAMQRDTGVAVVARIPAIGALQALAQQGLWARAVGSLLAAGATLPAALRQAASVVTDRRVARRLQHVPERVDKGDTLSDALLSVAELTPYLAWSVAAGERHEDLAPMLLDAADYIDREVDARTQHALRMMEPWVQCAIGAVVCLAMLTFWYPFYTSVGAIH